MTTEQFQSLKDEIQTNRAENKREMAEMRAEIKPVIDVFTTLRTVGKWVAVVVAFFGSITALALGVKTLFKK